MEENENNIDIALWEENDSINNKQIPQSEEHEFKEMDQETIARQKANVDEVYSATEEIQKFQKDDKEKDT